MSRRSSVVPRPWARASIALVVLLAGCERAQDDVAERVAEKLIEDQGREAKVAIDREGGSIKIELGRAIVPAGWPDDLPVFPDATKLKARGDGAFVVATNESLKKLSGFYREKLAAAGWSVEARGGPARLSATKADRRLEASFEDRPPLGSRGTFRVGAKEG